jgi:hypothetical protein
MPPTVSVDFSSLMLSSALLCVALKSGLFYPKNIDKSGRSWQFTRSF